MASAETKVGLLVITALAGLGWLSVQTDAFHIGAPKTRALQTNFNNVEGLLVGSQVKIAGVPIGDVTKITLQPNGQAVVHFNVKKDIPLPASVQARVTTSGLIGEKYIALVADPQKTGTLAETSFQIPAANTAAQENMTENLAHVADNLGAITSSLRTSLAGEANSDKIQNIVNSIEGFSSKLDHLLAGNAEKTSQMIDHFNRTAQNLEKITTTLANGQGILGELLQKPTTQSQENMITNLQEITASLKDITSKISEGQGTIGKLVNDSSVADNLSKSLDTLAKTTDRLEAFRTEVDLNAYSLLAEEGISKGAFNVTLQPAPSRYYVVGVSTDGLANAADSTESVNPYRSKNFGHEVKFTAQFGHIFKDVWQGQDVGMRLGLKESTAGIGFDTNIELPYSHSVFDNNLQLSADAYDFAGENTNDADSPHIDLKAKLGLHLLEDRLYTTFGYDNILNQEYGSPFIGLGYRFEDEDLKYVAGKVL